MTQHLASHQSSSTTRRAQRTPEQEQLRTEALRFQAMGLNVIANKPGTKQPAHYWKGEYQDSKPLEFTRGGKPKPNWTLFQQNAGDVCGLPWHKAGGLGLVNGRGDLRTFDFDKCSDPAIVGAVLVALDLPADYAWQWQSGSHNGYGLAVRCEDLPPGLFDTSGILIGSPREPGTFDHLELRASGCQTVIPPSLHKTGNHYRWLHGAPNSPPARITRDQLIAGFLAVAEMPKPKPAPAPRPAQRQEPIVVSGALTQKAIRDAVNATHPRDYLESKGSTTRKDGNGDCICGAPHSGDGQITYGRQVATCHSTRGDCLLSASGPNGRNSHSTWDLIVILDYAGDWRAAYIAHGFTFPERTSARQEQRQAPEHTTAAAAQRRAADSQRKRAAHCAEAAAIRSEVEQRAAADTRLKPADRATLGAMLAWAAEHNAACCWAGRASLARRAGYSLGAVKRAVMHLEGLGYFVSSGKGGKLIDTAKRTFTRGSSFAEASIFEPKHDPRLDHESDLISKPVVAGEAGAVVEPASAGAEWEVCDVWEAFEPEHGADELAELGGLDLSPSDIVMQPAPAEPGHVGRSGARWYAERGGTWSWWASKQDAQIAAGLASAPMSTGTQPAASVNFTEAAKAEGENFAPPAKAETLTNLDAAPPTELKKVEAEFKEIQDESPIAVEPEADHPGASYSPPAHEPSGRSTYDRGVKPRDAYIRDGHAWRDALAGLRRIEAPASDDQTALDMPEPTAPTPKKANSPNRRAIIAAMSNGALLGELAKARGIARYGKAEHTRSWAAGEVVLLEAERRARGLPEQQPPAPRQARSRGSAPDRPPAHQPNGFPCWPAADRGTKRPVRSGVRVMSSFHLKPITAQDAEREPLAQRLSFVRRIPSPATQAALAQAQQRAPPLLTDGIERQTARQLALSTAGNVENTGGTEP